jgi:hypothetical protein
MKKKRPPPHFRIPDPPSATVLPFKPGGKVPRPPPKTLELSEDGEFTGVIDMLYELIEDLEATPENERPTGIFVGMYKDEKDSELFPYYNYGLTRIELLGLLTQFLKSVI